MNNGGGIMGDYHLLSDRINEKECNSNNENPSLRKQ